MNLHANAVRRLRKILQWSIDGFEITKEEAREGLKILAPQKKSDKAKAYGRAARAKDEKKIAADSLTTKEIRAAVRDRAVAAGDLGWHCEAAPFRRDHIQHTGPLDLDHWSGGSGRRKERQSIETCWLLCRRCHMDRTANAPSAAHWNAVRRLFCLGYGYVFTPHIEHKPLSGRGTA